MDNNATKTQQGIGIDNFTFDLQRFGVCKIDDDDDYKEYDSIADAIAEATDDQTITMLADVTDVSSTIEVSKKITLDLNGYTISGSTDILIQVVEIGDLTVKDSSQSGTGKIQNDQFTGIQVASGGTLKVENGTISAVDDAIGNSDGTVTITGGTFTGEDSSKDGIIRNNGTMTISGGTFTNFIINVNGTITISGGTFTGGDYAIYKYNGTITISGGTFNQDVSSYLASGAKITNNENGTYTVSSPVCQIGETTYTSLEAAIEAATDDQTITMLADVTDVSSTIEVSKKITLDLNGHTISGTTNTLISVFKTDDKTGNLTVKDSSESGRGTIQNSVGYGIYVASGGTLTVESGTFTGDDSAIYNYNGTSTISGGTFTGGNSAIRKYNGTVTISGGTFNQDVSSYLASGAEITNNGDGTYTVSVPLVCKIGETTYTSLEAAITAAQEGDTITMLSDTTVSKQINLSKTITLDLNGYTISGSTDTLIQVVEIGDLTVKDSSESGKGTIQNTASGCACIIVDGGILKVENGTTFAADDAIVNVGGTVTITGGTFTGEDSSDNGIIYNNGTITISGGTFTGTITKVGGTITISGGTFSSDPDSSWLASGAKITNNENGTYTVSLPPVCQIGETTYTSLEAAITAAQAGDTITMLSDTTVSKQINLSQQITLDLNGKTISGSIDNYLIQVYSSGNLTVKDSSTNGTGTIQNNDGLGIDVSGTLTFESGTISGMYAIFNSGTVTISGGTFTGDNYAIINNSGTTEITGGTFTGGTNAIINNSGTTEITGGTFNDITSLSTSDGKTTLEVTNGKVTATVSNGSITKIEGIGDGETVTYNGKALSSTSTTEITANFSNGDITNITGLSVGASVNYGGKTYAHTITLPEGVTASGDTLTIDNKTYYANGTITISGFGEGKTISFDDGITSLEVSGSDILAKVDNDTAFTLSGLTLSESATSWKVDGTSASYGKKIGTGAKINGTTITYAAAETFESTFTLSNLAANLTEDQLNAAVSVSLNKITINSDSVLDKTKSVLEPADYKLALGSNVTKNEKKIIGEWKQDTADTAKYTYFDAGNTGGFAYGTIQSNSSTLETGIYYVEDTRTTITVSDLATGLSPTDLTNGISISFSGSTYKITFNSADVLNKKTPTITTTAEYTVEVASSLNPAWQNPNWTTEGTAATLMASTSDGYEVSNNAVVYIEESNAASRFEISGLAAGVEELSAPTGTVLTLKAEQLGNNAIIRGNAGNYTVQVEGDMTGKILSGTSNADTITMAANNALVKANSGDDEINVTGKNVTVIGGKGDDKITVNSSAVVSFDADSGNDTIYGYAAGTKLQIAAEYATEVSGDDVVINVGKSTLTLNGVKSFNETDIVRINEKVEYPEGISVRKDTLTASAAFKGTKIDLATDYPADVTKINAEAVAQAVTLEGNSLANSLVGGRVADVIKGDVGNDILKGEIGNDTLSGGAGNDTLYGGEGNDVFIYEGGNDYIADYAAGSDSIQMDFSKVTAQTVSGSNVILTIDENNTVTIKGAKDKEITFVDANGENSDTKIFFAETYYAPLEDGLKYDSKRVSLTAGADFKGSKIDLSGTDYLPTVEKINASAVNQALTITGNSNSNSIISGKGDDVINLGNGDKNSVRSGDGADKITGGTGNDILKGEVGNDTLSGGKGNNTLTGGTGEDVFIYGGGNDLITDYATGEKINLDVKNIDSSKVNGFDVVLTMQDGGTVTIKGAKNKTVTFVDDNNETTDLLFYNDLYYKPLDKGLTYNSMKTQLTADKDFIKSNKIDLADYLKTVQKVSASAVTKGVEIVGNSNNNSIGGSAFNDTISGNAGNDTLRGGAGADSINGGDGDDKLYGEAGDDTLIGGAGNNTLTGGAGTDVFVYEGGKDLITDYTAGEEIQLSGSYKVTDNYEYSGKNIIFTFDNDNTLTIKNAKNKEITINGNSQIYEVQKAKAQTYDLLYDNNFTTDEFGLDDITETKFEVANIETQNNLEIAQDDKTLITFTGSRQ